jgi:hypothetical protein
MRLEALICNDLWVTVTVAPNLTNSVFSASKRSVSFIFSVCKPYKSQPIPKPKQVTAIVWAMSGQLFN